MPEKKRWKVVEVKVLVSSEHEPALVYRLPSGYAGREIEVFEDAFETLEVKYVAKAGE